MKRREFIWSAAAGMMLPAYLVEARNPRGMSTNSGGSGPSAPSSLQLINQGGPNASQQGFYSVPTGFASSNSNSGSATGLGISANYQGFTWLPATPGSYAISKYNIYRSTWTLGVQGSWSLYDSVATPITITGYIAPTTDSLGQSVGLLTVTAISGGSSTNGITDGKILCGLKLSSAASGFVAGTKVVAYETASYGGGGTGAYYVDNSQTVGSSGSQQTFTAWSYNDTAATNCIPFNFSGPATVYSYYVTAVDSANNESVAAYPSAYKYQGISMTGQANFSFGGSTTWNDTAGSPVNGPFDIKITPAGGGYGFQPVWCGANGDTNNHTYMCPTQHFECGMFNYFVFDMKPTNSDYTAGPKITGIKRSFGVYGGVDLVDWFQPDVHSYASPSLAANQWSRFKIPFSAMPYGYVFVHGYFQGTSQYNGTFTVTSFDSMTCDGLSGTMYLIANGGPAIPSNVYCCGSGHGGQDGPNWTDPVPPYTGGGPWVFHLYSPNIVGTENPGTGQYVFQGFSCYKEGFTPNVTTSAPVYFNNIGFTTN